jgi:serine/threonine-protein kinase RsbW
LTANGKPSAGAAVVTLSQGPAMVPVLGRVVWMLAARADLPMDRLDDAVLVADTIAMNAPDQLADECLEVTVEAGPEALRMVAGPLKPGGAQSLIESTRLPALGNVLDRLASELRTESGNNGTERLSVTLNFD